MGNIYSIVELASEQVSFLSVYFVQESIITNDGSRRKLKKASARSCRFCGKSYPEVKFNSKAHLIPKWMGNINLKSDFECDACNNKFSLFETDFTSFLGLYRTLNPIGGDTAKFTSNTVVANEYVLSSGKKVTYLINKNLEKKAFNLDTQTGKAEATYLKPTYTPINVYKLLLKIALSCLPLTDVATYRVLLEVLRDGNNKALAHFAENVPYYRMSVKVSSPRVILFKRTSRCIRNFMHHAHIYFEEFLYIMPIPLNILDISPKWRGKEPLDIFFCPPILLEEPQTQIDYYRDFLDLSSPDKVKETEKFNFDTDPKNLTNLSSWDMVTGKANLADINGVPIEGMILTEDGQIFDAQDMAELQTLFKQIRIDQGFKN
jgi:hypothetical protein